ncbi:Uncharacterized conserved protein YdeI, YjbR/CyaY-like superfamily, DUF1801 family [Nocardioides scoriae]|uniref:Uncharacterized conserved protein YdeI, YjbR/CyaY-like superfamily, DUF1801 family n=1 Tax=Nocardioides scoriae TaxID=642780 RepID=A0A1H1SEK4_9ACTN|nr:YdeI/OmpD-associated family protein [Nocardioides scoriae]SDS46238.1 Uncharacterized conserved protein YdeI, YjbR/CyaY-like superfamily, DUF1801 family [Nocardioides scoriae]
MGQADAERLHVEDVAAWGAWLAEHHADPGGVWVVWWKRATGRPAPSYEELVREALCWGWIDSTSKGLDAERTMMWFTRRAPGSGWSRPNKLRLEELYAADRMRPPGEAVVDAARADGSWTLLDDVEALVVPEDLAAALADRGARERWDALGRSARRAALVWLVEARRPATRERRVAEVAERTAAGLRPRD